MIEFQELEKVSNVEKIRRSLEEIRDDNAEGLLTAEDIVTHAGHPDHMLHKLFDWDDSKAAHKYRLMQARALIRKVVVSGPEENSPPVPKYVSLKQDRRREGGGYRATQEVVNNKQLLQQLEETVKDDLDAVLRRNEILGSLCKRVRKAAGIKPKKKSARVGA